MSETLDQIKAFYVQELLPFTRPNSTNACFRSIETVGDELPPEFVNWNTNEAADLRAPQVQLEAWVLAHEWSRGRSDVHSDRPFQTDDELRLVGTGKCPIARSNAHEGSK